MKTKNWIILFVLLTVVIVSGIFLSQLIYDALLGLMEEGPITNVETQPSPGSYWRIFRQCVLFLFTLVCVPFILSVKSSDWKINRNTWWIPIIAIEIIGLVSAYLNAPPDMFSILVLFITWQLPVVINLIVVSRKIRKNK